MNDKDCTAFLQWALPQLELRWSGFRKVRRQVCKRLRQRMRDLGLDNYSAYRAHLEGDPSEWRVFDECCHITISRFFRDRGIFEVVRRRLLPDIAARAKLEGRGALLWSAGCASGEEPYTLKMLWDFEVATAYPCVSLSIVASDVDQAMLARAREGCFEPTSLHELPRMLIEQGFDRLDSRYCVKPAHREGIEFLDQDLPDGDAGAPLRPHPLPICRLYLFRCAAPAQSPGEHAETAPASGLFGDRNPRAIAERCPRAGCARWRSANLREKSRIRLGATLACRGFSASLTTT